MNSDKPVTVLPSQTGVKLTQCHGKSLFVPLARKSFATLSLETLIDSIFRNTNQRLKTVNEGNIMEKKQTFRSDFNQKNVQTKRL